MITELKELKKQESGEYFVQNGMLRYKNRLVLTSILIPTVLNINHDSVVGVHSGFLRTYKRLASKRIGRA